MYNLRPIMALHIASERVDRLARELASVTGERLTTYGWILRKAASRTPPARG